MNKISDLTFPAVLKSERKRLGWTRKKMSEVTGIPWRTIQTWESGKEPASYIKRYVLFELRNFGKDINPIGLLNQIKKMKISCTPSAKTKRTHIGEYQFDKEISLYNEYGDIIETSIGCTVPWTTIKEIMEAISKNWDIK